MLLPEKEKDSFYVVIKQPTEFRRNLLESTKLLIQGMQKYEHFKALRADKTHMIARLKDITHDINSMTARLKTVLPSLKMSKEELAKYKRRYKPEDEKETGERAKAGSVGATRPKSELDMLEDELGNIEEQLSGLE